METKDFYSLLEDLKNEQTFTLTLAPRFINEGIKVPTVECKHLTTSQLKLLIESVVSKPLTQSGFLSVIGNILKSSISNPIDFKLNILDRTLFILSSRINSISPKIKIKRNEEEEVEVDLGVAKNSLEKRIQENISLLKEQEVKQGNITIRYNIVSLDTEQKLAEEIYRKFNFDVDDPDSARKAIGDIFLHEITKVITSITIDETTMVFEDLPFKTRTKIVESLPASAVQKVIEYLDKIRSIIDESLVVDGIPIELNGSLFALR